MSLRTYTTSTVECDGPNCEAVFADVVQMMPETIASLARQAGWDVRNGAWYCLKCQNSATDDGCQCCGEYGHTLDGSGNCPTCVASMPVEVPL